MVRGLVDKHDQVLFKPTPAELYDQCSNFDSVLVAWLLPRLEYLNTQTSVERPEVLGEIIKTLKKYDEDPESCEIAQAFHQLAEILTSLWM